MSRAVAWAQGLGLTSGLRVEGLGLRIKDFGFRVLEFGD